MKKRVRGIGGVFFKSENVQELKAWYQEHLGLQMDAYGTAFEWRHADEPNHKGYTQWSLFPADSKYFQPSTNTWMINYRVENLEELVTELKKEGVTILDEIETFEYGKFVHILDIEGNKIELWEPIDESFESIAEGVTK